jgi:CRP-like cAMP-binding protein
MSMTDFLRRIPLFSALSDDELNSIGDKAETVQFVRDAFICKEGEKADSMFIIKSGIVQIFCDDGKGGRNILTHLKLGDFFGEMSLLTEEPRTASSVALAETEVLKIKKEEFYAIIKASSDVALSIIRTLCDRLTKTNVGAGKTKSFNVFAVLGPDTSSGKSLFARNLALAMQNLLGKPVLLYDPNVRDDKVARFLGVEQRSKIIDELVDRERILDIGKYVVQSPCGILTVLPQENGLTDLRLKEFHTFSLMKTVLEHFEFIVVDSSSMYTKVTKEIVQSCDKIIYLISSKNVSIGGLISHFDETRRGWKVDPRRVVYGVNHTTDDPTKESVIKDEDRGHISFELPFEKKLASHREPDRQVLIQREPNHPITKIMNGQAERILFDQKIGLYLPAFDAEAGKREMAVRWAETGVRELSAFIRNLAMKPGVQHNGMSCNYLEGFAAKWTLNKQVPMIVDFLNRYKREFSLERVTLVINDQETSV